MLFITQSQQGRDQAVLLRINSLLLAPHHLLHSHAGIISFIMIN